MPLTASLAASSVAPLAVVLALVSPSSLPPSAHGRVVDAAHTRAAFIAEEDARLRAHFAVVIDELERAEVAHLDDAQRLARARAIDELRAYSVDGRFPRNRGHAPMPTPIFVDDDGAQCAMGHLIAVSGEGALVDEIRATRNLATIAELSDDPRLMAWLDAHGLTLREAGRVQPSYAAEEPMVAGLCTIVAQLADAGPETSALVVDSVVTRQLDVDERGGPPGLERVAVELTLKEHVATLHGCVDEACQSYVAALDGERYSDWAHRFREGEARRGIAMFLDDEAQGPSLIGVGLFAEDGFYGDNADRAAALTMASGPLVHIPDEVLTAALTSGSGEACIDALLAHDSAALCHVGTITNLGSPLADVARSRCAALGVLPETDEPDDDGAPVIDAPEEPRDDTTSSCAATAPAETMPLAALVLAVALWRRPRARRASSVSAHEMS